MASIWNASGVGGPAAEVLHVLSLLCPADQEEGDATQRQAGALPCPEPPKPNTMRFFFHTMCAGQPGVGCEEAACQGAAQGHAGGAQGGGTLLRARAALPAAVSGDDEGGRATVGSVLPPRHGRPPAVSDTQEWRRLAGADRQRGAAAARAAERAWSSTCCGCSAMMCSRPSIFLACSFSH